MKNRYVILSVNESPEYLWYIALTCWAWRRVGWEPILFYHRQNEGDLTELEELVAKHSSVETHYLKSIPGYRSDTIAQISRLYGACLFHNNRDKDAYLMTVDADMIPLSDYWKPSYEDITVYGYDLTGRTQIPICYIGMSAKKWTDVMTLYSSDYNWSIMRDLKSIPEAGESIPWEQRWGVDQEFITKKLRPLHVTYIDRGQYPNGYAKGRIDRGIWNVNHEQLIDCHMHRDLFKHFYTHDIPQDQRDLYAKKWRDHQDMLKTVWPGENFIWLTEFTKQYAKLVAG